VIFFDVMMKVPVVAGDHHGGDEVEHGTARSGVGLQNVSLCLMKALRFDSAASACVRIIPAHCVHRSGESDACKRLLCVSEQALQPRPDVHPTATNFCATETIGNELKDTAIAAAIAYCHWTGQCIPRFTSTTTFHRKRSRIGQNNRLSGNPFVQNCLRSALKETR
jgi:hypothetical protein